MNRKQELQALADKIASFTPLGGPISLIARERRMIENALRLAAQADAPAILPPQMRDVVIRLCTAAMIVACNEDATPAERADLSMRASEVKDAFIRLSAHTRPDDPPQRMRDPEVVAAVQQAIMNHPHFKTGLGSSAYAFGLANTALDAYAMALTRPECGDSQ